MDRLLCCAYPPDENRWHCLARCGTAQSTSEKNTYRKRVSPKSVFRQTQRKVDTSTTIPLSDSRTAPESNRRKNDRAPERKVVCAMRCGEKASSTRRTCRRTTYGWQPAESAGLV